MTVNRIDIPADGNCGICLNELKVAVGDVVDEFKGAEGEEAEEGDPEKVVKLAVCPHMFHEKGIESWGKTTEFHPIGFVCPLCRTPIMKYEPSESKSAASAVYFY